jgi:uncharacterized hydrophobic protein (TIGR00271 family)
MKYSIPTLTPEQRRQLYRQVADASVPSRSFYLLVLLSTAIATYGLLANSTAVVIGAMLVAPLMGPIFGIGLALSSGRQGLLWKAAVSEVAGVALAVVLAMLIGLVPLRPEFGSEILARTQPTLYDLLVAIAAGLAGAYALVNVKISPALPGVAIATALVPPLATCGLCLSAGRWKLAMGAFLLFLANFLAIELVAAIVFTLSGMNRGHEEGLRAIPKFARRLGWTSLLLIPVGVFMTQTLVGIVSEQRLAHAVDAMLAEQVRASTGARLSEVHLDHRGNTLEVVAAVLTPQAFDPPQVARIEDALRAGVDSRIHLILRSLISKDADRSGPVFLTESERQQLSETAEQSNFLREASQVLSEQLQAVPGARLADLRREPTVEGGAPTVTAVVRTPTAISPDQVAQMEGTLRGRLLAPARLIVRSVLTRDADAVRYLYEVTEAPKPLPESEQRLRQRLETALNSQLAGQIAGAHLIELQIDRQKGRLLLLAVARTPLNFAPEQVQAVEAALRKYVAPHIDLTVRSVVGTDTTPGGYHSDRSMSFGSPTTIGPS